MIKFVGCTGNIKLQGWKLAVVRLPEANKFTNDRMV